MTPAVSILVPIYNVERYLEECLQSIADQTLRDIEVICINDGSTDGSRDIIQKFMDADARFKVIDKPNSGYGASMNKGLRFARGEYVGIVESDDFIELDAMERLYEAARTNDADVVKANFWFYWSVPEERDEFWELVKPEWANRVYAPRDEGSEAIFYEKPSIWSAIYRRSFLEESGIDFLETPGASYQDASFTFKVWACAQRVYLLHDAVLHYRQDNEASSVNSPGKVFTVCGEYAEISRYVEERTELAHLRPVVERMKYDTYMWNYDRLSDDLKLKFLPTMAKEFRDDAERGWIDYAYFDDWKAECLQILMESVDEFHVVQMNRSEESGLQRALNYYRHGGMGSLLKTLARRMRG
ncbi:MULTISPECIES: glycosyltransferase [unclassified Adlercreutzia]|uniref:glycosyltransferase n=1 Tax=unclassified Adlercreutzia TaxID=2636013 RepID=UPI0013E9D050|nr:MULTISPECIES: glycosyltransferase [unclassified Adlercreutzia]